MKDSVEYVGKVYRKIYKKNKVKGKDGTVCECTESEFALQFLFEDTVL